VHTERGEVAMSEKRPYVTFDSPDIQIVSMKKGWLNHWEIQWKKRGESSTHVLEINGSTVGGTNGGGFEVTWGD
jgi:hypothetical protein